MPGKSGAEVFDEIKKDENLNKIPICIITGNPDLRKLIYEHPEGYMDKPVTEERILTNIKKILELGHHDKVIVEN